MLLLSPGCEYEFLWSVGTEVHAVVYVELVTVYVVARSRQDCKEYLPLTCLRFAELVFYLYRLARLNYPYRLFVGKCQVAVSAVVFAHP